MLGFFFFKKPYLHFKKLYEISGLSPHLTTIKRNFLKFLTEKLKIYGKLDQQNSVNLIKLDNIQSKKKNTGFEALIRAC